MTYLWHESSKRNVLFLWSVLTYIMLMLCSFLQFLQFWIYRALEYLISHLITPGQPGHSSRDTTDRGRGWNFVKIFSMSDRLSQQWKHFIMELYQWLSLCRIMCYVDRSPSRVLKASPHSLMFDIPCPPLQVSTFSWPGCHSLASAAAVNANCKVRFLPLLAPLALNVFVGSHWPWGQMSGHWEKQRHQHK